MDQNWEKLKPQEALSRLGTSPNGLSHIELGLRRRKYGQNKLMEKKTTELEILARQFRSIFFWILLAAAVLSFFAEEHHSALVIGIIAFFVCAIGFFQEYKANRAVEALKKMLDPQVRVIRQGVIETAPAVSLVPGDIVVLKTGDKIPADSKIIEMSGLRVDESIVTGESEPVEKHLGGILLTGSHVVYGTCKAVVFATGMNSHLGKIAKMMEMPEEEVPLQKQTKSLTSRIAFVVLIVSVLTLIASVASGYSFIEASILAVAVAVSGIPEALPLTVTVALAIGMKKMAKNNAIPKTMTAVETLGSVTVICSDKTGTITKNQMTITKIYASGEMFDVTGEGYDVKGEFGFAGAPIAASSRPTLHKLLLASTLCNDAELVEKDDRWSIIGTPTEGALLVAAAKADIWKKESVNSHPRRLEVPFSSESKYMVTVNEHGGKNVAYMKGAPERVLRHCDRIEVAGKVRRMGKDETEQLARIDQDMASGALRVLAVAYKPLTEKTDKSELEGGFILLGLVGMLDPPKKGVAESVEQCRNAGIKVIMITGDHPHTALAIAKRIGLDGGPKVITGDELSNMSDKELAGIVDSVSIFARTHPNQKLRIVNALKAKGHIVAMTGDGVNDAPAIKAAHVGVAMGLSGTEVSTEAADMILEDDNFATIVKAIRRGRGTYENLRKFTAFLLSCNMAEVSIVLIALILLPIMGFEATIPLLALQILILNLIIDDMPAVALGVDPIRSDIMQRPPRKPNEPLLSRNDWLTVFSTGIYIAFITFAIFVIHIHEVALARTMTFTVLVSLSLFNIFNFRSLSSSAFQTLFLGNKWLGIALIGSVAVVLIMLYHPYAEETFDTVPLSLNQLILVFVLGATIIPFMEIRKFLSARLASY
ncbi:MAG: HAD-IC family P-type ATPase [Candidatus Micrarchaeota archaeon]